MDTAEALKQAMQALRDAGIPEELWETALPLALADIRAGAGTGTAKPGNGSASRRAKSGAAKKRSAPKQSANRSPAASDEPTVLAGLPDEDTLLKKIASETGVAKKDLADLFHVESGKVHLKVPGRQLGANSKAATMTIAALLGGVVFAGTDHRKLPFKEINDYLKAKNVFHDKNASTYIKATPGFASVANGRLLYLTTRTGWAAEFALAAARALGKSDEE